MKWLKWFFRRKKKALLIVRRASIQKNQFPGLKQYADDNSVVVIFCDDPASVRLIEVGRQPDVASFEIPTKVDFDAKYYIDGMQHEINQKAN